LFNHPITRFVILSEYHYNNNILSNILNSHPSVLCHGELFNPGGIYYSPLFFDICSGRNKDIRLASGLQQRNAQPLRFLNRVWQYNNSMPCVGFELIYQQNDTVFNTLLNDTDIKKIVLLYNKSDNKAYRLSTDQPCLRIEHESLNLALTTRRILNFLELEYKPLVF